MDKRGCEGRDRKRRGQITARREDGIHLRIIRPGEVNDRFRPCAAALGFFDGVHKGHAAVIAAAASSGLPTVAVTFSNHPGELLGRGTVKTIMTAPLKEKVLGELGVDAVYYIDFASVKDMSADEFLRDVVIGSVGAKRIFCGYNYRFGRGGAAGSDDLKKICKKYGAEGGSAAQVNIGGAPVSSTRIRALIERGEVEAAAELLGRRYGLYLEVVHGRSLARSFGTPTINQTMPQELLLPRFGVYASLAHIGGGLHAAVTNVGVKPTVGGTKALAETYIMDYDGDLYGRMVQVDLVRFMRPEQKFSSLGELRSHIVSDAEHSRRFTAGLTC